MQNHDISSRVPVTNTNHQNGIDWNIVANITPPLLNAFCWIVWGLFLLVPTLTGSHGTGAHSTASNAVYVLVGLTFCTTIHVLLCAGAGVRAVLFALVLFLLAYWF